MKAVAVLLACATGVAIAAEVVHRHWVLVVVAVVGAFMVLQAASLVLHFHDEARERAARAGAPYPLPHRRRP